MSKYFIKISIISVLICSNFFALGAASENGEKKDKEVTAAKEGKEKSSEKASEEKPKEKSDKIFLSGKELEYIVQTGMMPILKDDGKIRAQVFYIYYAVSDGEGKRIAFNSPASRPVMFCFNGGPGASSAWLHLGGIGPKKIKLPADGLSAKTVAEIIPNPNTVLDFADLVFVDPVSTGLSRVTEGEKPESFFGVEEDIQAAAEFIRLFTTREQRWQSPKFLCGESYGAMRVAGLSDYLQDKYSMYFDGLILISGLLNFQTILSDSGNDLPYIFFLPNMTATAYYHGKLPAELQADLKKAVSESKKFAYNEYAIALLKGNSLSSEEKKAICEKLSNLTGLDQELINEQNLRIDMSLFRKMLLRKEGKIIGRFDGRVSVEDSDKASQRVDFDPSLAMVSGVLSSGINSYVRSELGYESDTPYHLLTGLPWRWSSFEGRYVSADNRLARAFKKNPQLRILVITGMRDLAVPEASIPYSIDHINIPETARSKISFVSFESGHMMYFYEPDAKKLRETIGDFIGNIHGQ